MGRIANCLHAGSEDEALGHLEPIAVATSEKGRRAKPLSSGCEVPPRSRRWRVTLLGHAVMSAAVRLREEHFPDAFLKEAA